MQEDANTTSKTFFVFLSFIAHILVGCPILSSDASTAPGDSVGVGVCICMDELDGLLKNMWISYDRGGS